MERAQGPNEWDGVGVRVKVDTLNPKPRASPGYPPRLQVARRVSPALPHGRVGPTSPTRSLPLPLPLLRVLLNVLGVPLPDGVQGLLGSWGWPGFTVRACGRGALSALLTHALHPTGAGDRVGPGPREAGGKVTRLWGDCVDEHCGSGARRVQRWQPLRVGITGVRALQG